MKPSANIARVNSAEDTAGVSISFDPQALQEEEEAREEQQLQHELQALVRQNLDDGLTTLLTDDEDEDDEEGEVSQATFDPDISSEISSVSDQPPHMLWPNQGGGTGYEDYRHNDHFEDRVAEPSQSDQTPYASQRYTQDAQRPRYPATTVSAASALEAKSKDQASYYRPVNGGHVSEVHNSGLPAVGKDIVKSHYLDYGSATVHGINAREELSHYPINSDAHPFDNAMTNTQADYANYPIMAAPNSGNQHQISEDNLEDYRVKYAHRGPKQTTPHPGDMRDVHVGELHQHTSELRSLQEDFLSAGGVTENSRLSQLQILCNSRGRKIEELDNQLKQLQDDSGREIRILKHKMALMQDEKAGIEGSLQQCQNMLSTSQEHENKFHGQVKALEATIQTLQDAKTELVKKLQSAESSVESLNSQLIELGSSDSLARARQHHESAVGALQKKYDAEMICLKEKLDQQAQENFEKSNEVSHLRKQIEQMSKSAEEAQISKADTINRLTRSLEESQRQCQQLLESNSGQANSRLKFQLQESVAAKSISEDLNNALQIEIKDLKEQLTIYESASTFGVLPSGMTSTPAMAAQHYSAEDSFAQLGLRKARTPVDFNTPDSIGDAGKLSKEDSVASLKHELERCVNMYRNKRHQVGLLQEEMRVVRNTNQQKISELQDLQQQYATAKDQLKDYAEIKKTMETGGSSYKETKLQRQVDNLIAERKDLLSQIKDLEKRIDEIAESESETKEVNRELSGQMAEMVRQFDDDKRQALLSCEETMNQHFESMKGAWREEGKREFEEEKERLDELCSQLKFELEETKNELDEVKDLYIKACNEKDELEHQMNNDFEEKLNQELDKVKAQFEEEKSQAVDTLKGQLTSENLLALESAKDKWLKEHEATFKDSVKTEIVLAKTLWIEEQNEEKETAVKSAVEQTENKWTNLMEDEIQSALEKAQEKWSEEQEIILKDKLEEAHAEWRRTELPKFLENNRSSLKAGDLLSSSEWQREKMKLTQEKDQEKKLAVQEARAKLDDDYKIFMTEHREALNKALKTAQEQHEKEKQDLTAKYEDIIQALRIKQDMISENKVNADEVEEEWKAKLEEVQQENEREKEEQASAHRENLYRALEEARHRWQKKFEEAMTEQETEWNMDRDKMLKEAENHVEMECQRLQQQHQQEIQELQAQNDRHLDHALNQLREELVENDMNVELAQVQHQMQRKEDHFNEEIRQLKQDLEERMAQIQEMQQELHKVKMQVVEQKQDYEYRLEKAEGQKQEAISAYSQSEKEHAHMIKSYKTRLTEMGDKLHRMENKLKAAGTGTQMQLEEIQASMEREYTVAMENMKEKMLEMQKNTSPDKDSMKRKRNSSVQTLDSPNTQSLEEMRNYYLDMITKIRKDVMQHVSKSNEEAACKVRLEVLRERHFTAKRLRKYYLKCLTKLLENFDEDDKDAMMAHMELMLHNIPEKDSTCSSLSSKQGFRAQSINNPSSEMIQMKRFAATENMLEGSHRTPSQTLVYNSAVPSNGYPIFSRKSLSPSSAQQYNLSQSNNGQYVQYQNSNISQSLHSTLNSTSGGHAKLHEQISSQNPRMDDGNDGAHQLLSTGDSATSSASNAWATPSELFSHLSPEHKQMLENAPNKTQEAVSGLSPPTNEKGNGSPQKYYKLDLQILDMDKYNSVSNPTSEFASPGPTDFHFNKNRKEIPDSSHTKLKTMQKTNFHKGKSLHGDKDDVRTKRQTKDVCLIKSNSDDCLNNSNNETQQHKPMTSTELRNLTFRRVPKVGHKQGVGYGYFGSPPSKSQSMPNVADAAEKSDCDESLHGVTDRDRSYQKLPQSYYQQDSFNLRQESATKKLSSLPTQTVSAKRSHYSTNKKEGYRVSFKNVDLDSTDASDNESVKSFTSTTSVSEFRDALKNRRGHVRSSGHRPLQISAGVGYEKDDTAKALHRPIALITRHTQMPSPLPLQRK